MALRRTGLADAEADGVGTGDPGVGVRRDKAAFFSGCKSHPATIAPAGSNRSSHGGNEVAEASGVEGHFR